MESADPPVLHLTDTDCYQFHYSKQDLGRNSLGQVVEFTESPTAGRHLAHTNGSSLSFKRNGDEVVAWRALTLLWK